MSQSKNQKKLISFTHFDLINSFVKDEATANNRNESAIIEDILLEHYLSGNQFLDYPITQILFEESGLSRAAENIFTQFAARPEYVDDSAYPLVSWFRNLEWRFRTDISKSRLDLSHFIRNVEFFKEIVEDYLNRTGGMDRTILDVDGKEILVSEFELRGSIDIFSDILKTYHESKCNYSDQDVMDIYNFICFYWNLPLPDGRPLHKFSYVYRWLADVMQICDYPSTPELRYDFVKIVRNINFMNK